MRHMSDIEQIDRDLCIPNDWRILVTGITSIHGWPVFKFLSKLMPQDRLFGIRPPGIDYPEADNIEAICMTDRDALKRIRERFDPTHVVHCAGVCDLDVCEERPEWAHRINVQGAENMADLFGENLPLVYISTDLVFSGEKPPEGGYTEEDETDPVSVAGRTFVKAERRILKQDDSCVIRLSLPLGDSVNNKGAIDWIEGRFMRGLPVTLFHDEVRSCIECEAIGPVVIQVFLNRIRGLYNLGGDRSWSLYEIGKHVLEKGDYSAELLDGTMRHEEINGPPRIGDVTLNSLKLKQALLIQRT
ncbi:MAG: sugar nucleotide-binding protein [Deltaproteobacteria bacterium]|nr:sugar nucleotide-binding protein [Deltaproteobacteria bacterium]